jgi:hypothetical protein
MDPVVVDIQNFKQNLPQVGLNTRTDGLTVSFNVTWSKQNLYFTYSLQPCRISEIRRLEMEKEITDEHIWT